MITFAEYMDRILYGPAGYYSTGTAKSGKSGDYFTAPDVGPVFGQLLAEIFLAWREKLGYKKFSLIEVAAGDGKLAKDILISMSSRGDDQVRYIAVERSASRCASLNLLKEQFPNLEVDPNFQAIQQPLEGVLFGNELIDAFAVHRVRMNEGKLRELFVDEAGDKRRFLWREPSTPRLQSYFDRLGIVLPDGYETEVNLAMSAWLGEVSNLLRTGLVLIIDYGRPAHDYYAPERNRGTLRAFSKHKVSADFLDPSGMVDLTADVDFSSLALDAKAAGFIPLAFMEMGTFLMMGLVGADLVSARDGNEWRAGTRPAPTGLKYLLHPEGMGAAFHVLILGKNINAADWTFEHNRLRRLGLPA